MMCTPILRGAWCAGLLSLAAATASAQLDVDFTASVVAGTNPLTVQFTDATSGGTPVAWNWDFGDGSVSSQQDPTHTYTAPGVYDVRLTAFEGVLSSDVELKSGLISVAPAVFDASFTVSGTQGTNPFPVQFSDTSTGPVEGWLWDFGDGSTSTEQDPEHVYSVTSGTTLYTVSLTTFVGQQSESTVMNDLISVDPAVLVPSFTADVTSGIQPLEVQFTDTSLGPIDSWTWDLGSAQPVTQQHPSKTFFTGSTPTSVDISLTVTVGDQVETLTQPAFITVDPAPVVLDFETDVRMGVGDATVQFTNLTTGYDFLWWSWDFGDGSPVSNEKDPVHRYFASEPTRFDVTLTASVGSQIEVLTRTAQVVMAPEVFGPRRELVLPAGLSPFADSYGTADLDGDGQRDLITRFGGDLSWHPSPGSGEFADGLPLASGPYGPSPWPQRVEPTDIDGDGDTDVLIPIQTGFGAGPQGGLLLVRNQGGGSFTPVETLGASDRYPQRLVASDLDGDGDLDMLAADLTYLIGEGLVWWHENLDGLGSLGPDRPVLTSGIVEGLATGDLDGDGDQDVVVASRTITSVDESRLEWVENLDGLGGSWSARLVDFVISDVTRGIAVGDVDADGDLDLFDGGETLRWWPNDGAGGFPAAVVLDDDPATSFDLAPRLVDVDADGDLDVVASGTVWPSARRTLWYEHLGAGGFTARRFVGLDVEPSAFSDVDGDGDLDMLSARGGFGSSVQGLAWVENVLTVAEWDDLGQALSGSAGEPAFIGSGALAADETFALALRDALPGSITTLVVGASELSLPFKGGVLVPNPDLLLFLPVGANGVNVLLDEWPAGIAAGVPLLFQHWIADGAGPVGLAASNALRGETR